MPDEDCACGFDGEWRMCINRTVYGPCEYEGCGGVCEAERDCDHECHMERIETDAG
jgi:hypothetical protein